jgi:hypothetical protein
LLSMVISQSAPFGAVVMDKDIDKCVNKSDGYAELKKYWCFKTKKNTVQWLLHMLLCIIILRCV